MADTYFVEIDQLSENPADVAKNMQKDPLKENWAHFRFRIGSVKPPKSNILVFAHDMGGGADMYLDAQCPIWMDQGNNTFILRYKTTSGRYCLKCMFSEESFELELADWADLESLLRDCPIDQIIVNELVTYPELFARLSDIRTLKQEKKARLTMLIHDYLAVSPSYHLISPHDWIYARVEKGFHCDRYFKQDGWAEKYNCPSIEVWRQRWEHFLLDCDEVRCFSEDSRRIMSYIYPTLRNITVVPHVVTYMSEVHKECKTTATLNIGVLGILSPHKGRAIVRGVYDLLERENRKIKIILIGYLSEEGSIPVGQHFEVTGRYGVEDIPQLVVKKDIDLFLVSSICPETFSYTTEEIIQMGMPIACLDLGAPAERVRNYDKGLVLSSKDPLTILMEICAFARLLHIVPIHDQEEALVKQEQLVSDLPRRNEQLLDRERNLRRELAKLQAERITTQEQMIQEKQVHIQELEAVINELQDQLKHYRAQLENVTTQLASVSQDYDCISNSHIWKATKPLRATLDTMKRVFRHKLKRQTIAIPESAQFLYNVGDPMVILCTLHTLYVAKLIRHALEKAGISAQILSEEPSSYSDRVHIVICPQMFRNLPGRYIAFQMEQTISSRWLTDEYYNRLRHAHSILDYSLINIKYFRGAFDFAKNIYYLPIDYLPGLTKEPNEYQYEYDVVFYGDANSPRRKRFLKALQERFSVKVLYEVFGEELYDELRKAKVVVNIHYYENAMLETTRLYEVLSLGRSVIVSERSVDPTEETRLEDYVDFVPVSQIEKMIEQVDYWLSHEEDRLAEVKRQNEELSQRTSSFDYFFYRYLLANDWISFDRFYELAGGFVNFDGNRVCLSLPESVDRREEFDRENRYGFEVFPGLRHTRGWTGCGLSYKFIMKKAQEQHLKNIVVCEDDVLFPDGFEERWKKCMQYLSEHTEWNIFQGLMSDVGKVKISEVNRENGETFVHLDHMISMVFNFYDESVYPSLIAWDETNDDVYSNTIDRALEAMHLNIITTVPFLVGHKEDLSSDIWGFQNTQYNDLIASSSEKLVKLVEKYEADSTEGAV